jgi:hypothetical protein
VGADWLLLPSPSELLPTVGAANAGTVRNRTLRVGSTVAQLVPMSAQTLEPDAVTPEVIVGLDGGYVRSRHPRPERNFEIVVGKVSGSDGSPHHFAFARNGGSAEQVALALVRAGVRGRTIATVLSDGDAGLRDLQRRVLPKATVVSGARSIRDIERVRTLRRHLRDLAA